MVWRKDKDFNLGHFYIYLLYQSRYFSLSIRQSSENCIEVRCVILEFGREIWARDYKKKKKDPSVYT